MSVHRGDYGIGRQKRHLPWGQSSRYFEGVIENPPTTTKFEIVTTRMGALSIRDNVTKEIMHNPVGPWVEANSLYIEQSQLSRRLSEDLTTDLVIFDVGLGAAANALAVLHCARALCSRKHLHLISFERDLELLKFALDKSMHFSHFAGFESAIQSILQHGSWQELGITWELRHGSYVELIDCEPHKANLVFYDPYSFKKNTEMWVPEVFRKTLSKCRPDGMLFTYSRATPVRVSLLMAGFYVGEGVATGEKEETTQASLRLEDLTNPLNSKWFGRWQRSHYPNAVGAADEDLIKVQKLILSHPQFRNKY